MSDPIKHECGIVLLRLLKPMAYYEKKYGSQRYGLNMLYLLMEKQHNRGQEGAGIATVKLHASPGEEYIFRERALGNGAISEVFNVVNQQLATFNQGNNNGNHIEKAPFLGEIYMGHLRYGTIGRSGIAYTHPFLRRNNWRSRNLCLAGNFNLANVNEIFDQIVAEGQHPRHNADTFIILEQLGNMLDSAVEELNVSLKSQGFTGEALKEKIEHDIDIEPIVKEATKIWDGGFVITGMTGSGDAFVFRDQWGIRPAYYFANDEIIVVTSERPAMQTVFNLKTDDIHELPAGAGMFIKKDGSLKISQLHTSDKIAPCSFERIYFSRGSDRDIYQERKMLGKLLTPQILESIKYDLDHTVLSFIPNTAEVAYYGMMEGFDNYLNQQKTSAILHQKKSLTEKEVEEILAKRVRTEKLTVKDIKLRTFITEDTNRNDLAAHVYDVTYGIVREHEDNIVVIDDSIVRGTTLKQSIIKIISRLNPKKIIIVSSSPQIRYPDCYGIDMSRLSEFIAFTAAIALLKEQGRQAIIDEVYRKSKAQENLPKEKVVNYVKEIYTPFTDKEIAAKISQLVRPDDCHTDIEIIYQTIENLHHACPNHKGDWYFSGDYPTPGGNKIVNQAFINYYENKNTRPIKSPGE
ncbi:amidophosphoribosyltransferase [Microbacter margulisiae]|nr:amidophosphoribosyltransferase [Microbacter margulisiae]